MTEREIELSWAMAMIKAEQEKNSFCHLQFTFKGGKIYMVEKKETFVPPQAGATLRSTGN